MPTMHTLKKLIAGCCLSLLTIGLTGCVLHGPGHGRHHDPHPVHVIRPKPKVNVHVHKPRPKVKVHIHKKH